MTFKLNFKNGTINFPIKSINLIKLFSEIENDFDTNEPIELLLFTKEEFEPIISLCEAVNFEKLKLPKPLFIKKTLVKQEINKNENLKIFFENLNLKEISSLINLADYLQFELLEDLIYFKIYQEKIFNFNVDCISNDNKDFNKEENLKIYEKYFNYCENCVKHLNEKDVNEFFYIIS